MDKKTLKNIFNFLEKEDNKNKPFKWKLLNNEPLTEDELTIKADLDLENSNITSLPEGLMVYGTLDLYRCKQLTSLPEDLYVSMNLDLAQTSITSLPDGLQVGGRLNLASTKITSLPKDLQVNGFLSLAQSDIESLPEGLSIGGSLDLSYCNEITLLPKGLEVGWNLNIRGTKLQKYTDDELREMIKPGFIEGEIF
jgi:hypothetical protein